MATTLMEFTAHSFDLPASNPPGSDVVQNRSFLGFNDTTEEICYSKAMLVPQNYAGGTLTARIFGMFATETTVTSEAVMGVSIEAIGAGDSVDMDAGDSFDTENTCEIDPVATAGFPVEGVCTLTNKDSMAIGDQFRLKLARKVGNAADIAAGDFRVTCVEIREA